MMMVGTVTPFSMKLLSGNMVMEYFLSESHSRKPTCLYVSPTIHAGDMSDTISPCWASNSYMWRT